MKTEAGVTVKTATSPLERFTVVPPAGAGAASTTLIVAVSPIPTPGIPANPSVICGSPTVAVKVTGVSPATVAVAVCVVATRPRVQVACAWPLVPVTPLGASDPPSGVAHATGTAGTGLVRASRTSTTSG